MITYQIEPISADILNEAKPLLMKHWEEIAVYKDIPLNPNFKFYERSALAGMILFTVRDNGKLMGYATYIAKEHLNYQGYNWAASNIFWLHPDLRGQGVGDKLFELAENHLRSIGVNVMHTTFKSDNPAPQRLLERRGHAMVEMGYELRLR